MATIKYRNIMALSLSFPSSKADSGQSIFKTRDDVVKKEAKVSDENEGRDSSQEPERSQKPWKSTPSLHLLNKSGPDDQTLVPKSKPGASFIPVPVSKRPPTERTALTLENLNSSNKSNNSVKGLPDVTESPQTPFSSDKPCDLLAQLEIVKRQRDMETSSGRESGESDSVDDNGNPVEAGENPEDSSESMTHSKYDKMESADDRISGTDKPRTPLAAEQKERLLLEDKLNIVAAAVESENTEKVHAEKSPDEPKYFINAAALSEDNFELPPSPAPSPCSSQFSSLNYVDPYPSLCPFVPDVGPGKSEVAKETSTKQSNIGEVKVLSSHKNMQPDIGKSPPRDTNIIRPRVPVSKSFPDIVQTTFSNEEKDAHQLSEKTTKDNSDTESLVADSLEELRQENTYQQEVAKTEVREAEADKPLKAFEQPLQSYVFDPMTESQMGGISAEKPPEAWVIDFNSLSLDSDLMESSTRERKSSMGSNPNSLAFFVNLNDKSQEATSKEVPPEATLTPDKKIFTMFVGIGSEKDEGSQIPLVQTKSSDSESLMSASMTMGSKRGIINKPVVNIMETSGCGLKYPGSRRFPSPIFQHRAAAEASRKAARMEFQKEREKHTKEQFLDSLEPHSAAFMQAGGRNDGDIMLKSQLIDSTSSNRSSLHVANVLDASFTSSLLSSMENSSPAGTHYR